MQHQFIAQISVAYAEASILVHYLVHREILAKYTRYPKPWNIRNILKTIQKVPSRPVRTTNPNLVNNNKLFCRLPSALKYSNASILGVRFRQVRPEQKMKWKFGCGVTGLFNTIYFCSVYGNGTVGWIQFGFACEMVSCCKKFWKLQIHIRIHFANSIFEWLVVGRQLWLWFVSISIRCAEWRFDKTLEVVNPAGYLISAIADIICLLFRNWRDVWLIRFCLPNCILYSHFRFCAAVGLYFALEKRFARISQRKVRIILNS